MTPRLKQKISDTIAGILPRGEKCTIAFLRSGVRDTVIVRVVTSAWKSLPAFLRVLKIQRALQEKLTLSEQQQVFRVSVLTGAEHLRQLISRAALKNLTTKRGQTASPLAVNIAAASKAKGIASKQGNSVPWIKKKVGAKPSAIRKKI